jgi:glycosyltransferase involved in cell wall biosynthesis
MNVSVIITNYNYGRFLAATIESAMNQTYAAKEVIVVDDGSSDESAEIIRRWEKEYPGRAIGVFQANAGQAAAINRAFESSTGEILTIRLSEPLRRLRNRRQHRCSCITFGILARAARY